MSKNNAQLINQHSGDVEFYTPETIVDLARKVLINIDLDPSSCEVANRVVRADHYFTEKDDGLSKQWFGRVWMNHPFQKGEKACAKNCKKKNCKPYWNGETPTRGHCIKKDIPGNIVWTTRLSDEYIKGNVKEAICITFSSMSEGWMEPLIVHPQCFPRGRVNYRLPDGTIKKGVTKGSVITYMGSNVERFKRIFETIGTVKI